MELFPSIFYKAKRMNPDFFTYQLDFLKGTFKNMTVLRARNFTSFTQEKTL